MRVPAPEPVEHSGAGRVHLDFRPFRHSEDGIASRRVAVPPGVSVFDAASWNGIAVDSTCGGHGTCKKCKVRIDSGDVPATKLDLRAFDADEIRDGWRLACVARAVGDLVIEVPPMTTRPKAATFGVGRQVILRPAVIKRHVQLVEPTLQDQRSDITRLLDALEDLEPTVELEVLRTLPHALRANDFSVTAVIVDNQLIGVEADDTTSRQYGIAFDLGTTTVVATLLDCTTGAPLAVHSMLNLQQPFGADVITRISAVMLDPSALGRLQGLAHQTLEQLASETCVEAGVDPQHVYEIAVAGNATMIHLALGIDPESLGAAPFVMTSAHPMSLAATDFGVLSSHPRARAFVFPALGAYVGGDIIAGALATGIDRDNRIRLFIDVGTNCEIILSDGERLVATAAPAGPAFEAASIRCGMRASAGAIETVQLVDGDLVLGTIDDAAPVGICGSGLVDACAVLVMAGLLDASGRFVTDEVAALIAPSLAPRLRMTDAQERVFILSGASDDDISACIYLSQRDVRELQFAKAAISTGWALLLEELGIAESDVQQVLLAGSFGSYLSPANAVLIGLVPKLPILRIVSAGNVAGEGAKIALLSVPERNGSLALLDEIRYVELSDRADFNDLFIDKLGFPT